MNGSSWWVQSEKGLLLLCSPNHWSSTCVQGKIWPNVTFTYRFMSSGTWFGYSVRGLERENIKDHGQQNGRNIYK